VSARTTYHDARTRALFRELDANPDLMLMGSSVTLPFNPDIGLDARYGDRILWPPISEFAAMGIATGAAMAGVRTLMPISTSSFMFYGWPAIVQEAANVRYLSGGQTTAPVTFHIHAGSRRGGGAQHEHTPHAMLQNIPGLRIYAPGTPSEVDAVFHAALTGSDPVLIVDHLLLADAEGQLEEAPGAADRPTVLRAGTDLLVVSYSLMAQRSLRAAELLAAEGVSAAVMSVGLIHPMPVDAVLDLAAGYERVVFVDESRAAGSPMSLLMARMLERGSRAHVKLVCTRDAPAPYAVHLLDEVVPTTNRIVEAMRDLSAPGDGGGRVAERVRP
jgi:pyruvate dehydrogenase E1 component beta subunit